MLHQRFEWNRTVDHGFALRLHSLSGIGAIVGARAVQPSATEQALMKLCYLINQYPKVRHRFIRRKIVELEIQDAFTCAADIK
jgi:hypothetical protein